jgi:DNA polymerase III epsilon subunit family exonuclease
MTMLWLGIGLILLVAVALVARLRSSTSESRLSHLPEQFVVFDLETTGLQPDRHEIIEIGAILVNRDSINHTTFQGLVKPSKRLPAKIVQLTGITQAMIDVDGEALDVVLPQFLEFVGDRRLVSFNSDFDMAFLRKAVARVNPELKLGNGVSCALKMARLAWPGRKSYRLAQLAADGGLPAAGTHRALDDCKRALIVYTAAASKLRSI